MLHSVTVDNKLKHTAKATSEFVKGKEWDILQWLSQSRFSVAEGKTEGSEKHKQAATERTVKAWQCISREETQHQMMSIVCRLGAVIGILVSY